MTSVAYIGPKSRIQRAGKTKNGTEVTQVTRDSGHLSQDQKVKGLGYQTALLTAVLARKAAVVDV